MQCHTQVGNITTNLKGKIDFTLTELRTTKNVTWNYHVDDFAKGIYEMILGRDLLKELGLNIKLSQYDIEAYDEPLKVLTALLVHLNMYDFNILNSVKIIPEEPFMNSYAEGIHELEQICTSTKRLRIVLDAKYEKADLNKDMKN